LPASPHPVSSFQVRSIVLPALRCTFWSPGPNSNIPLPVFNLITGLIPPSQGLGQQVAAINSPSWNWRNSPAYIPVFRPERDTAKSRIFELLFPPQGPDCN
jgi:hypothetical protein